jgi:O-antigen ligase
VIALSASRVSLALAVAVGGLALVAAATRRALVGGALCLAGGAGVALELTVDAGASEPVRVAVLIAVVALAAPLWLAVRTPLARRAAEPAAPARSRWAAPAVLVAAVLAGGFAFGAAAGRGVGPAGGFLHGRASTWRAAIETFADRPFSGTGADAFLTGSARHQGGQTIAFAHSLPLELAAELGLVGLVLAIALYAAVARGVWRARHARAAWLLGPAAAAFLIASLVDWPWHLAGAGAVWALAVGALAGGSSRVPRSHMQLLRGDR